MPTGKDEREVVCEGRTPWAGSVAEAGTQARVLLEWVRLVGGEQLRGRRVGDKGAVQAWVGQIVTFLAY